LVRSSRPLFLRSSLNRVSNITMRTRERGRIEFHPPPTEPGESRQLLLLRRTAPASLGRGLAGAICKRFHGDAQSLRHLNSDPPIRLLSALLISPFTAVGSGRPVRVVFHSFGSQCLDRSSQPCPGFSRDLRADYGRST
jgi:hypothetical protein